MKKKSTAPKSATVATQRTETSGPSKSQPLLLAVDELAELLSLGVRTVWRYDATGMIPAAIKLGRTKRWRKADIELWIELGCPKRRQFNKLKRERTGNGKTVNQKGRPL